jgi:4-hydroxythreonine-4-phosphate dehydrogenase
MSQGPKKPRVGITLGDVTGVGPEVTLKALDTLSTEKEHTHFTVFGDERLLARLSQELFPDRTPLAGVRVLDPKPAASAHADRRPHPLPDDLPAGAAPAARAAVEWIREGARLCLAGELDAMVTAPVNKHAIVQAGVPFTGHTELLSELAGEPRTVMMLLGPDDKGRWLRVALATVHIALREVSSRLTTERVLLAVQRSVQACRDLGLPTARIGVCGLNPHAGEGGEFGDEEIRIIEPALEQARRAGVDVAGPLSGDTVFHQALHGEYDAVVAMYHDQGLAPLKLAAFDNGVNWTLGLPFIRTSPDHGTAYNIAGKGVADGSSMVSAIRLAIQLASQR